jgi:hypothetical protein
MVIFPLLNSLMAQRLPSSISDSCHASVLP